MAMDFGVSCSKSPRLSWSTDSEVTSTSHLTMLSVVPFPFWSALNVFVVG